MAQTYHQLRLDLAAALAVFLDPDEAHAECIRWFEEGLDLSRTWMAAHGSDQVPAEVRRRVSAWVRRRRKGEPWAYILGWTFFRDRRFKVSSDTLIPRPETELLVEAALDVGRRLKVDRCVDVGTGSGIIAVSLALETGWQVTASDLSPGALAVAAENAQILGAQVSFLEGSLLEPLPDPVGLVVANLPYVDPADQPTLQRELTFEPASALFAPDRGLALSETLLRQARERQASACLLEIGAGQGGELCRRGMGIGWSKVMIHQDLAGHDRILVALA
ncbi:MAG: peptide chain release factor N(5)-glutamine methyltransferase [Geothrix sp.]|uniref:peptide chain release factor N(5)-glutamine methyltransferase n=1 Tax=Geothrix sp. TaxID=1962974 RepID=UPI0017F58F17|nr:peptide chain release factor N(5)-glutamine methyltransferase [Geothrix sp.]NWJ40113.1 peptide chain release factor N(5)-glutamine methyltransferase [Geothrix sp.]WIL21878.1 MAG: peptide chain release factor N(5)-glutamine methyltransferase [Geothrix sp.]